jgi:hypothetical protein
LHISPAGKAWPFRDGGSMLLRPLLELLLVVSSPTAYCLPMYRVMRLQRLWNKMVRRNVSPWLCESSNVYSSLVYSKALPELGSTLE